MKRRMFAVLILAVLALFSVGAAASASAAYPLYMIGHVDTVQDLVVTVNESVLPFDLEDSVVAENPNTSIISGLLVAYYSFFTNDQNFSLVVTHTPLVLSGAKTEATQFDSIDYRLYVVTNRDNADASKRFKSCLSSEHADNVDSEPENYIMVTYSDIKTTSNKMISLVDHAIYVSLEDVNRDQTYDTTQKVVENLAPGYYTSTLYFYLTGS